MRYIICTIALIIGLIGCFAGKTTDEDVIYDPIQTPIYMGKTLYCSKISNNVDETPCDKESRLILCSPNVEDTVTGILQYKVTFDTTSVETNKELLVKDIDDISCIRCDKQGYDMNALTFAFRNELLSWHWWLGDYLNPHTLYPQQVWTIKFIVIPAAISE